MFENPEEISIWELKDRIKVKFSGYKYFTSTD